MKIPGYQVIFNDYEAQIRNRRLLPGSRLPSESELCRAYDVSRITVRKALEMLEERKLVERRPGVGSFVIESYGPNFTSKRQPVQLGMELFPLGSGLAAASYYGPIQTAVHQAARGLDCRIEMMPKADLLHRNTGLDGRIFYTLEPGDPELLAKLNESAETPTVLINRIVSHPEIGYVSVDHRDTVRRIVEQLLRNGARNVAIVGSHHSPEIYSAFFRTQGWRDAYLAVRHEVPEELCCDFLEMNQGFSGINRLLANRNYDVLFVAGGNSLPMTLAAVAKTGLSVPEDLSIICFDNVEESFLRMQIPLSFIRMPLELMSSQATEHLVRLARGEVSGVLRKIFPASLVATDCRFIF